MTLRRPDEIGTGCDRQSVAVSPVQTAAKMLLFHPSKSGCGSAVLPDTDQGFSGRRRPRLPGSLSPSFPSFWKSRTTRTSTSGGGLIPILKFTFWHVIVEDNVDSLNIHTTAKQVGCDQDSFLEVLNNY